MAIVDNLNEKTINRLKEVAPEMGYKPEHIEMMGDDELKEFIINGMGLYW